jgi:glutaredoxin-like protein
MFLSREGQRVPEVTFHTREGERWVDVTTAQLFAGKRVAAFALPGAFTPTCSSAHLPRFNELAPVFRENGLDDIICLAVNDAFVMEAWKRDQRADQIRLIPDGNGEFADKMGMLVDMSRFGYGRRSWRYSMLVCDGLIEKMFIEPEREGDPFEVSDADTLLRYVNPAAREPPSITLFVRDGCRFCARARALLQQRGFRFEEIRLGREVTERSLRAVTGASSVPQVYVNGRHIGGSDELEAWLREQP